MQQTLSNLATARALLRVLGEHPSSNLAEGVALAKVASEWQGTTLRAAQSVPLVAERHTSPSEALIALAEANGVLIQGDAWHEVQKFDALPEPIRESLVEFVDAFLSLESAARATFGAPEDDQSRAIHDSFLWKGEIALSPARVAMGLNLAAVLEARNTFLDAVVNLHETFEGAAPIPMPLRMDACPAFSIDLSGLSSPASDDEYADDCVLILDTGGNDVYTNNAGGSGAMLPGGSPSYPCKQGTSPAAALVDFDGEDLYAPWWKCAVNGAGYSGVGVLIDTGGRDHYDAAPHIPNLYLLGPSNGGGVVGAGFLLDAGFEADVYEGDTFATNGGAVSGAGFLLDMGGDDQYIALGTSGDYGGSGTNGGASGLDAAGFLLDVSGDDSYAARRGANGGVSGGLGLGSGFLLDASGGDSYVAEDCANGGVCFAGVGFLLDVRGNDFYSGRQSANGGGTAGFLLDLLGTDMYHDEEVLCNGSGIDVLLPLKCGAGAQIDVRLLV